MIIYIDENMPHQLAEGLDILQQPQNLKTGKEILVRSISKTFGRGAKDEEWIPLAGEQAACVITQDVNIQRTRLQKELFEQHGLGMIFLHAPSKNGFSYWQLVQLVIKHWEKISQFALKDQRPFAYRCTSKGELEKIG